MLKGWSCFQAVKALYRANCKTEEPNSGNKGDTNVDKYLITASLLVGMFTIITFFRMVYTSCPEEQKYEALISVFRHGIIIGRHLEEISI